MLPVADGPQTRLLDLPAAAFSLIFSYVIAIDKPGRLVHFLLACKGCQQQVVQADSLWAKQCRLIGWLPTTSASGAGQPAPTPPAAAEPSQPPIQTADVLHDAAAQGSMSAAGRATQSTDVPSSSQAAAAAATAVSHLTIIQPDTSPEQCFAYYSARMLCRWRLRRVLRRYTAFLPTTSQRGLNPGASLEQLAAAEAVLGFGLPWELWELYRWRDGQHAGLFADTACFLDLSQVCLEYIAADVATAISLAPTSLSLHTTTSTTHANATTTSGSSSRHQGSQEHQQQQQQVAYSESTAAGAGTAAAAYEVSPAHLAPPTPGCVVAVVFAAERHGAKRYAQLRDGRVFLLKGFTQRQVSPSLTAFLNMLLS